MKIERGKEWKGKKVRNEANIKEKFSQKNKKPAFADFSIKKV